MFGVEQTQMVEGMAGGVNGEPVAIRKSHRVAVGYSDCGVRREETAMTGGVHVEPFEHHLIRWRLANLPPGGPLGFGDPLLPELDDCFIIEFEQFGVEVVTGVEDSAVERLVGEYLCSGDLSELVAPPEVVRVTVSQHHRVNPFDRNTRGAQAIHQRLPRLLTGKTRIDQSDTVRVFEGITVHMPQPGHGYRQLHPQDPGGDFKNFCRSRFLFLFAIHRICHPGTLEDSRGSG